MTRVLFFRDFDAPSGGHSKLRDYYDHVRATEGFEAGIAFTKNSQWNAGNPWFAERDNVLLLEDWCNWEPDVLFLEGLDWLHLSEAERANPPVPVINLIQGLRHADPANPRFEFLSHPATRICVSPEVQSALEATGRVNGRLFTNPNGIDFASLPAPVPEEKREWDVLIAGAKHPARARALGKRIARLGKKRLGLFGGEFPGLKVRVLDTMVPREEFLKVLADSRIAVLMPLEQEGFYLPALEAMALGTLVVCPDVVGNRSFCLPGENCFRPHFSEGELFESCRAALRLALADRSTMLVKASETAARHTLWHEREGFQAILREIAPPM